MTLPARPWEADVQLSQEEATRLIDEQFPLLRPVHLDLLGEGWDNWAYLVNETLVFRFPRRKIARELLDTERAVLPSLSDHLPLAVPTPAHHGQPDHDYPYPFLGYPRLPGRTGCQVDLDDDQRLTAAPRLGTFLGQLHRTPEAIAGQAPTDTWGRAQIPDQQSRILERLSTMHEGLTPMLRTAVVGRLNALAGTPLHTGPLVLNHGDLYGRHLLFDKQLQPSGVIDWGDLHRGDPAIDLSVAYAFFDPRSREALLNVYGDVPPAVRDRARFRALCSGCMLVAFGIDTQDQSLLSLGKLALHFALRS